MQIYQHVCRDMRAGGGLTPTSASPPRPTASAVVQGRRGRLKDQVMIDVRKPVVEERARMRELPGLAPTSPSPATPRSAASTGTPTA